MSREITVQINQLRKMTVGELRKKYREVYGEGTKSGNRDWLWKRIAWRIQEQAYGGLSERAKQRAEDIADEADIRLRVPKNAFSGVTDETGKIIIGRPKGLAGRDKRLPAPGTIITREYKAETYAVKVLDNGFEYDNRMFRTLSSVAREITGSHWNGFAFFNLLKRRSKT